MESEKKAARVEIFFMRPESSALSLHHIKTTVFTVILVLPCISEPAERTGIGTTERRPSISSRDSKSRHVCVCFFVLPFISELVERTGIGLCQQPFDSPLGVKKRLSSQSFWYSLRESNPQLALRSLKCT